jgi:hypothetical protein
MGQILGMVSKPKLPECAPILRGQLSEELRLFLLSSLPSDAEDLRKMGFEDHVDHPTCAGHHYLEGYFHSVASSFDSDLDSVHPRLGCAFKRRPAPAPLIAFCEAFRRANAELFTSLKNDLAASRNAAGLANVLERQMHFADLSVQVHWGDEVPSDHVAWHIDAPNSFLHLAVSLSGSRVLHARRRVVNGRVPQNCLVGMSDERETLEQHQGDTYMSSPCCFPHAVEYPACSWDSRIVAVQVRLFLNEEELFGMLGSEHTALDIDPQGGTASIVFRRLSTCGDEMNMPDLALVQKVIAEYQ